MKRAASILYGIAAVLFAAMCDFAAAQDNYPAFPIKLVVAYPPGTGSDVMGRLLAQKLTSQMSSNIVVDNKFGANGSIGAEYVATAKPDGYTLLLNTSSVILNVVLGEKVGFDVFKDLAPVALLATAPQLLVVHPSVPSNTVPEFITYLRANPDKLAYGSAGIGNSTHLAPLLFLQANGLSALHVPYKGASFALTDLVAGRVQFSIQSIVAAVPFMKDKRIKALAYGGRKRSPLLPELPTLAETMPGFEFGTWFGVMAPAKMPPAILRRLNGEMVKALNAQDLNSRLAQEGIESIASTPEEYGAYLKSEMERWAGVVKTAGVKLQ